MFDNCDRTSLKQYLGDSNIFTIIKSLYSFPFLEGEGVSDDINNMLLINYGQRGLFSGFKDISVENAAKYIIKIYADKWDKLILSAAFIDNLAANNSRKTTDKTTETGSINKTDNTTNKVSAYNSDDLVTESGVNNIGDENSSKVTDRKATDDSYNLKTLLENLPLVERTNIINIVLKDVSNYLTVSIY